MQGDVAEGGGGGAVGVEDEFPAPPMDGHQMMEGTQQAAVIDAGGAAFGPGDHMMDVAAGGPLVAAGEPAVRIPAGDSPAQVHRAGVGGGADVQAQADCSRVALELA